MPELIDLRSDTVTRPSERMRQAMASAEVGDDVYGEDPTVNRLEAKAAEFLGQEASLFVPSGTMANNLCVRLCCPRGAEMIVEATSHLFKYEGASAAQLSQTQLRQVAGARGILDPADVEAAIRPDDIHQPPTAAIAIENTHNMGGGAVYPLDRIRAMRELADRRGILLHMDGARLVNAAIAGGYRAAEAGALCDTLTLCLSKGLGAPVGSMVASGRERIAEAQRVRKMLGGGMRQAGVIAAAGLYALENNVPLLQTDHENARRLEAILRRFDAFDMDGVVVETNMIIFATRKSPAWTEAFVRRLAEADVLINYRGGCDLRIVTNLNVSTEDVERVGKTIERLLGEMKDTDAGDSA